MSKLTVHTTEMMIYLTFFALLSAECFEVAQPRFSCEIGDIVCLGDWPEFGFYYFDLEQEEIFNGSYYHIIVKSVVGEVVNGDKGGKWRILLNLDKRGVSLLKLHLKSGIEISGIYLLESDGQNLYYHLWADRGHSLYFRIESTKVSQIGLPRNILIPPHVLMEFLEKRYSEECESGKK